MILLFLPQTSVSHDSSKIIKIHWFHAQQTYLIIINEYSFRGLIFQDCDTLPFKW